MERRFIMITKINHDAICGNYKNLGHQCAILLNIFSAKLLLLLFLLSPVIIAQTISDIKITGNKVFSVNDYIGWIRISPGAKIFEGVEDSIHNRIIEVLKREGYYHK